MKFQTGITTPNFRLIAFCFRKTTGVNGCGGWRLPLARAPLRRYSLKPIPQTQI